MKRFISLFLVISMIMCNLNTRVVEALSTYCNEVKSLVNTLTNTKREETVDLKEDKGLGKEKVQVPINNVDNTKSVDSKAEDQQVNKSLDKNLSIYNDEDNVQENVTLVYNISTHKLYYLDSDNNYKDISWINEKIITNKINLNDILDHSNSYNTKNTYGISTEQEVNLIITGSGSDEIISFDNTDYPDIPFNIEFNNINGENCQFLFGSVKSICVKGKNTITTSSGGNAALTYSFDGSESNPLKIYDDNSSFIVYSEDSIDNNIVCSDDFRGTSIVNMSFEDDVYQEKNFILEPTSNGGTQKKFSTRTGYNALSILLVGDNKDYILKEDTDQDQVPYYYRTNDYNITESKISGTIKTKFTLKRNVSKNYYNINNTQRVEVIATQNGKKTYYLVDSLEKAMNTCVDLKDASHEVILIGNYEITQKDAQAIKDYNKNSDGITFRTKIDDWTYLLNVGVDIELMSNKSDKFSVTFDDIDFKYTVDNKWICANGTNLTFGYNIEMEETYYPSILLGKTSSGDSQDVYDESYLNINSGTYNFVIGNYNSTLQNISITINEGNFKKEVVAVAGKVENNATLTINAGTFYSEVLGSGAGSDIGGSLNLIINEGNFKKEVIATTGKVVSDIIMNISSGTFYSKVLGSSTGSNIQGILNISIDGGTFKSQVIGINGGTVNSAQLIINGGTFNDMILGASSNTAINKFTLKGLLSRGLVSNNERIALSGNLYIEINGGTFKGEVHGVSSEVTGVNINIKIKRGNFSRDVIGSNASNTNVTLTVTGGTFKGNLMGNAYLAEGDATINVDGNNIIIPIIADFTKLVVGGTKKGTVLKVDQLDRGLSKGDLYLKNGSKVSFRISSNTSELNDIILEGKNNALVLPSSITENTIEDKVLIDLFGDIKVNGNKLNIELKKSNNINTNGIYLIKFEEMLNSDVTGKYNPPTGCYVRDNQEDGYVILCPQTTFNLKYDLKEDKLYMINNGSETDAWWYTGNNQNTNDITLDTDVLYKYKGYDLFKGNDSDRNIILTGTSSDKNITVSNNLYNVNLELDRINLTDSSIKLNNIKTLKLKGTNIIKSINSEQPVFTYTFKDSEIVDKVLFDDTIQSYLEVCTKKDTNPLEGPQGNRIDLKFYKSFKEDGNEVRLKNNNTKNELNLIIPTGIDRLCLLLKDKGSYNLYYGTSGDTGDSVYVSGNTNDKFTDLFETSSNNVPKLYEYVRRAHPISKIDVQMPSEVNFGVNVRTNTLEPITLDLINKNNWEKYFYATEMKFKNNSTVIQDLFIDEKGESHQFGKGKGNTNADINLEYMGVYSKENIRNDIRLISKEKLTPSIEKDNMIGVNLALKLDNTVELDDSRGTETPLGEWTIPYEEEKQLLITPNFGESGNFFNISKNISNTFKLNSYHKFMFRYGLKK